LDQRFDGIILDRRLPDGDGLDLLWSVCARIPDAHVVVCSDDREDCRPAWVAHVPKADTDTVVGALGLGHPSADVVPVIDTSPDELVSEWEEQCRTDQLAPHPIVAQRLIGMLEADGGEDGGEVADQVVRDVVTVMPETAPVELAVEELHCLRAMLASHIDTRVSGAAVVKVMARANGLIDATETALLARELERLRSDADTDALTGLLNRRAFDRSLSAEVARALRHGHVFSLVVADLDGLKQINDGDGHLAGDFTLRAFAAAVCQAQRASDSVYRVGGDEFILLLPQTAKRDIANAISRIVNAGAPSFSWGAATFLDDTDDPSQLVAIADSRLIQKRQGERN